MLNNPTLRSKFRKERRLLGLCDCWTCQDKEMNKDDLFIPGWIFVALIVVFTFIAGCFITRPAHADITEQQAVNIIVGEAANQGEIGMICVAEVLRVRNSPKGFYGPTKKHLKQASKNTFSLARKAWLASKNTHYTKGADHFENVRAFGCPTWVKYCVETFRHKDHIFYREVKA